MSFNKKVILIFGLLALIVSRHPIFTGNSTDYETNYPYSENDKIHNIESHKLEAIEQRPKTLEYYPPESLEQPVHKTNKPSTKQVAKKVKKRSESFRCDGRQHCSQMRSYEEAKYFIRNCPNTKMDGDGDGIPCERQFRRYD